MGNENLEKKLDVTNKGMELANKIYDDGLSRPIKTVGNGLDMCLNFVGAIFSPVMYEYIQNAEYKKQEIDKKLSDKYNKIPEANRTEPRMNIMGPAVELLKYNLDENHIKDIFVNIMSNEMNTENQKNVLPSYIEIVKQLSKDDAKMLNSLYELYKSKETTQLALEIIRARPSDSPSSYVDIDKYIIGNANRKNNITSLHTIKLSPIIFDNLARLEIIKIHDDKYIPDIDMYDIAFDSIKYKYDNIENYKIYYEKGIFEITEYGINFIKICFE